MELSPEREQDLVVQNMSKIYRAIDNFMARCTKSPVHISYEDCVQEVSIAFLKYIRRCSTEDQLNKFPWYDAIHALSEYVMQNQQFSVPIHTKGFLSILRSLPITVPFDLWVSNGVDVDGMSKHWVPDTDTKLDFDAFMSSQAENIQRIASMRIYGMSEKDIAAEFGISQQKISQKINKLREKYEEFIREDDEE